MADQGAGDRRNGSRNGRLSARDAVQRVREDFPSLLGRPIEAVRRVPSVPMPEHLPRRTLRVRLPVVFELQ